MTTCLFVYKILAAIGLICAPPISVHKIVAALAYVCMFDTFLYSKENESRTMKYSIIQMCVVVMALTLLNEVFSDNGQHTEFIDDLAIFNTRGFFFVRCVLPIGFLLFWTLSEYNKNYSGEIKKSHREEYSGRDTLHMFVMMIAFEFCCQCFYKRDVLDNIMCRRDLNGDLNMTMG